MELPDPDTIAELLPLIAFAFPPTTEEPLPITEFDVPPPINDSVPDAVLFTPPVITELLPDATCVFAVLVLCKSNAFVPLLLPPVLVLSGICATIAPVPFAPIL